MINKRYKRFSKTHSLQTSARWGIEVLIKLAKAFNVSVDYLIGDGEFSSYDKDLLKRIEDIEKLDDDTKQHLFFLIDNVIQNFKTKKAFAK